MTIDASPDASRRADAEGLSDTVSGPEASTWQAADRLRLTVLKANLDAAVMGGGRSSSEDVLTFVREHLERRGSSDRG